MVKTLIEDIVSRKMAADLFSELTAKPQREIAGSDSASRFDYQKNWAFCQMLRKHIDGEDYLVAFEFHDDVVFLAPSDMPSAAEFCQVKTSSSLSPRKLSTLTNRPKGKASILAKMFSNLDGICASHDISVVLVSNNVFEFSDDEICAKDIDEKFRNKIIEKLEGEIPGFDSARLERLHFKVTGVCLEAMGSFLDGKAMDLFCQKFGEDHGLNVRTWIRLLQSEIARKNNYPSDKIATPDELVNNKCISQSVVEDTLNTMHYQSRPNVDISFVLQYLISKGWNQVEVTRLQKKIPEANKDFYDPTNREVASIAEMIKMHIYNNNGDVKEIDVFLNDIEYIIKNKSSSPNPYLHKGYLLALGVLVYYEEI